LLWEGSSSGCTRRWHALPVVVVAASRSKPTNVATAAAKVGAASIAH
jgi:hypothetical protein